MIYLSFFDLPPKLSADKNSPESFLSKEEYHRMLKTDLRISELLAKIQISKHKKRGGGEYKLVSTMLQKSLWQ